MIDFKRDSIDCKNIMYVDLNKIESRVMIVHTIRKLFEGYTKKYLYKSKLKCELKCMVGHPSDREYKDMVNNKLLPNFPIPIYDINNSESIFLSDLASVRVKTVRNKPSRLDT